MRSSTHRGTKTGSGRIFTFDGDKENSFPGFGVVGVGKAALAVEKNPVLHSNRLEFTGANAKQGAPRRIHWGIDDLKSRFGPMSAPELQCCWKQEALPGMRPDGIAEIGLVVPFFQTIRAGSLPISPADG